MNYDEIHPAFRALIGYHEAFRRLGFPADSIFVTLGDGPNAGVAISILRHMGKEFAAGAGRYEGSRKEFTSQWTAFTEAINDGTITDDDLDQMWRESVPYRDALRFIAALQSKGIVIPKNTN